MSIVAWSGAREGTPAPAEGADAAAATPRSSFGGRDLTQLASLGLIVLLSADEAHALADAGRSAVAAAG